MVSFEEVFNKEINIDENVRIILIEKNGKYIGILASDIEDIVSVPEENIAQLDNNKTIIGGNVILDKEIVNLLNINWLISNEN